ncbi:MAG: hypothetical protein KQJ78_13970 [Deltaproteobacteria bacterium]|nr:hypothetical protein [Deltaproteobacteria bacterium]
MPWFTKLRRLRDEDRAVVAVTVALLLTGLVGMAGAAVDLGVLYAGRSELQNAADAAALAGANTLITYNANNEAVAQASVGVATAKELALANEALGVSLTLLDQDITMGFWDFDTGDFDPDRTGPSSNPDDLTGFEVLLRRDGVANSPVATFFAGILGLDQVDLSASSVALLGWTGAVPEGTVDLPIAVAEEAISDGDNPLCGTALEFHPENEENASWTTFFTWPANDNTVRDYVDGTLPTPPIAVGDEIALTNGTLSQQTFQRLMDRFASTAEDTDGDGEPDHWLVTLPVVQAGANSGFVEVVGFCHFVITAVEDAPEKTLYGHLQCGMVIPNTETGGGNYGTRATASKLVR